VQLEQVVNAGFTIAWAALLGYWLWSSRSIKASARTEPVVTQLLAYWLPLTLAFFLLGPGEWFEGSWLAERFVPKVLWVKEIGLALAISGVALACWARHVLGRNWSSVVQLKRGHELIDSGPYSMVRHPIYSGLLLAFVGTALKVGDWRGLLAVAIVLASFWRKLRLEELWLAQEFGEAYSAYARRTKALVPRLL
jgi:protein-S-isoprenylcysteine O-methyltransferase Ste14